MHHQTLLPIVTHSDYLSTSITNLKDNATIAHLLFARTYVFQPGIVLLEVFCSQPEHERRLGCKGKTFGIERSFSCDRDAVFCEHGQNSGG